MTKILGGLVAAVPVAFAAIRAATTGTDFRYFWLALVSTVSAGLMVLVARRALPRTAGPVARVALTVFVATGATAIASFAVGAGAASGVALVAGGFACCSGVGLSLVLPQAAKLERPGAD